MDKRPVRSPGTWTRYRGILPPVKAETASTRTTSIERIELGDAPDRALTANFDDVVVDLVPG